MSKIRLAVVFLFVCLAWPAVAIHAASDQTFINEDATANAPDVSNHLGGRFLAALDVGGRLNPPGLAISGSARYRYVFGYDARYNAATSYVQTGAGLTVSPAMMQAGLSLEVLPWIILPLRIQYDFYQFTGVSGGLLSFASPNAPYGDDVRSERHDEERTHAHRLMFQPTLQGKIDRFVFRNTTDLAYYKFSGRGPYFLELSYDTLLKDSDGLLSNRTFLLYSVFDGDAQKTVLTGPYYEITRAFDAKITQQKIGWSAYVEPSARYRWVENPYLGVVVGFHLQDPNRQGQLFLMIATGIKFSF